MAVNITSLTASDFETSLKVDTATASRLYGVAVELVQQYAPLAPVAVMDESVTRIFGYLNDMPKAALRRESAGDFAISYTQGALDPLRHSGAMAILSPFKRRRAGAIG